HSFSTPDLMTFVFSDSIADRFYLHSCPTRRSSDLLEPTHDEAAIAAALAVTKAAKPAVVVLVGDNLDLPEFGRYRLTPAFMRTTQPAIDRATTLCAELRRAAPNARIVWLAGNHEERLPNWLLDNAAAAHGLRQGNTPESWPVMSAIGRASR